MSTREVFHSVIHKSIFKKHRRRYVDHHQEKGKHIKNISGRERGRGRKKLQSITSASLHVNGAKEERESEQRIRHNDMRETLSLAVFCKKKARISHLHKRMQNVL